jgi:hypothetical protein
LKIVSNDLSRSKLDAVALRVVSDGPRRRLADQFRTSCFRIDCLSAEADKWFAFGRNPSGRGGSKVDPTVAAAPFAEAAADSDEPSMEMNPLHVAIRLGPMSAGRRWTLRRARAPV